MDALLLHRGQKRRAFFADTYNFADMAGQKLSGVKWQGISVYSWVENSMQYYFKKGKPTVNLCKSSAFLV